MMVASVTASAFFPASSSSALVLAKSTRATDEGSGSFGVKGSVAKPTSSSGGMQVQANAQALPKVNGTKVSLKVEPQTVEVEAPSALRTFYNQLPDWSFLFAAIPTTFLVAEKQFTPIDRKPRRPDMLADAFQLRKIMQDGMVFSQSFSFRSYEMGQIEQLP